MNARFEIPESDWLYEKLQPIVDRLTLARWLKVSRITADRFEIVLTERGIKRMNQLARFARRLIPELCKRDRPSESDYGFWLRLRLTLFNGTIVLSPATWDLLPPRLSAKEDEALRVLVLLYARGELNQ